MWPFNLVFSSFRGLTIEKRLRWPSVVRVEDEEENLIEWEKSCPIVIEKEDERIVCGIVYQPDEVDAQGDEASEEEIRKAAYDFMENCRTFKLLHKGKSIDVAILESYIAPQELTIADQAIKKGSWVVTVRVNDLKIWKLIKNGDLTGFSMAGTATAA